MSAGLIHLDHIRLADVQRLPIEWLWPGRVALGKLTMIAGDPGLGKSLFTLTMAAHVSTGGSWPVDHATCPQGSVVILSAEDDPGDTIAPRLDAAGADTAKIHAIKMTVEISSSTGESITRGFSLRKDVAALSDLLRTMPDTRLVIIDPISAYLDGTDGHSNSDVRGLLMPLAELASKHRVALVCVSHLNKGSGSPAYRVMGSLAFSAAARAVFAVGKDPGDEQRRLVLTVKNNLAPDRGGLAYRVEARSGIPVLEWDDEPVHMTVDQLLNPPEVDGEVSELGEAKEFLTQVLADGPMTAKEVQRQANEAGLAWRTVRRAQSEMGIRPTKTRFDGHWEWSLTNLSKNPHPQNLGHLDHLRGIPAETPKVARTSSVKPQENVQGGQVVQDARGLGLGQLQACKRCAGTGCHWCLEVSHG